LLENRLVHPLTQFFLDLLKPQQHAIAAGLPPELEMPIPRRRRTGR
jgi:hypothetical protein